jgi:hypothetical protein
MGADVCALFGAGRGSEIGGESRCVRVFVAFAVGVGLARALRAGVYPRAFGGRLRLVVPRA